MEILARPRQANVAHHRSVLLRQAGAVKDSAGLALDVRSHAEKRSERDDAAAANPGNEYSIRPIKRQRGRQRQPRQLLARDKRGVIELAQRPPVHRHEARAKALEAREILVAAGLVDLPLASIFCFDRLNGDAIRLLRAVAAALADR